MEYMAQMSLREIRFIVLFLILVGCVNKAIKQDESIVRALAANGFNEFDSKYLSKKDSCFVVSYIYNNWEVSPKDVPRIFSEQVILSNFTAYPVNFSYCLINSLSNKDSISYLGLGDIYQLRHSSKNDSIISVVPFENPRLQIILNKYLHSLNLEKVPNNDWEILKAFLYSIYYERWSVFSMPSFTREANMLEIKRRFALHKQLFDKDDSNYIAFEVEYFGYIVFEVNYVGDCKIELKEYLLYLNEVLTFGYDVEPQFKGCSISS